MLVKVDVYYDGEYWCARGIGASFFTQGKTYEKLLANLREAAGLHFEEEIESGEPLDLLLSQMTREQLIDLLR